MIQKREQGIENNLYLSEPTIGSGVGLSVKQRLLSVCVVYSLVVILLKHYSNFMFT